MLSDPVAARSMRQALSQDLRQPRRSGPWLHLLSALFELTDGRAELLRHAERGWASATFSGTRHTVVLAFTGAQAVAVGEAFIAALPEHEFAIPRQLVAEAAVIAADHVLLPQPRLEVEVQVLLLDDA